ncbi:MAG: OmpA family protein [Proteobacteria bacterium]|nr:OmpA family protein [Pseudomonadota bacterium]MBU1688539.1 OmpA family protein [Pseudomonadota bacterium]
MKKTILLIIVLSILWLVPPVSSQTPRLNQPPIGTLKGQIFLNDLPQKNVLVSFFVTQKGLPPVDGGKRRVPEVIAFTDAEGMFTINLIAAEYYLGMLKRDRPSPGPPRPGEKYYFATAGQGVLQTFAIQAHETLEAGRINGAPPDFFADTSDSITVTGVVRDEQGNPFPGVIVLGKSQLSSPKPEFISQQTDAEGRYTLKFPPGIPFYLIARQSIIDARPLPGTSIGTYGIKSNTGYAAPSIYRIASPPPGVLENKEGGEAQSVSGQAGETISGIDIDMYKIPNPESIKVSIQGSQDAPKFSQGATLKNIHFDLDSHLLNPDSSSELDQWLDFLRGQPGLSFELNGHTDNSGSRTYNLELSLKRAQAVADYLAQQGISSSRMKIQGFGPDQPRKKNDSPENRRKNRRVEIKFTAKP